MNMAPTSGDGCTDVDGNIYINPVAINQAKQINGNVGPQDASQKKHEYRKPTAAGESRQINGNVSSDVGLTFFA